MPKRKATDNDGAAPKRIHRTRSVTADPGRTCFLTAELLENILVRLSPQGIFLSQRVSRQFRDLVRTSGLIKEKLFICVRGDKDLVWEVAHGAAPALRAAPPGVRADNEPTGKVSHGSRYLFRVMPVRLNPSLELADERYSPGTISTTRRLQYSPTEYVEVASRPIANRLMTDTGGESWQLQYLTDPPCKAATIIIYWKSTYGPRRVASGRLEHRVQNDSGLTFYDLWRAIWVQKERLLYWTGSQHHNLQQASFRDVWRKLKSDGHKSLETFETGDMTFKLKDVVVPTEDEWGTVQQVFQPSAKVPGESIEG